MPDRAALLYGSLDRRWAAFIEARNAFRD